MPSYTTASRLALAAALLTGTAAAADVTAEDVWANWQEQMGLSSLGGVTVGSETYANGVLTVTDLGFSSSDGEVEVSGRLDEITFTENGDGTVSVSMSETYPLAIRPEGSNSDGIEMSLVTTGMDITASGDPGAITYDIAYDRQGLQIDSLVIDGEEIETSGGLFVNDVTGSYTVSTADAVVFDYEFKAASVDLDFELIAPEDEGFIRLNGDIADLALSASGSIPQELMEASQTGVEPDPAVIAEMAVDLAYSVGPATYSFEADIDGDMGQGNLSVEGAGVAFIFNKDSFGLLGGAQGLDLSFSGFGIPLPIDVQMEEYFYGFAMPLSASEEPREFGLRAGIRELQVNDIIWGLADPMGQIPHDPVTVTFELGGTATLDVDLLSPEGQMQAATSDDFPGTLGTLTVTNTLVEAAGARLAADGAFEFDNSDTTTLDGVPFPVGELVVTAEGINALMDSLVAMGLLPQDQVMGARMMMGMFAVPTGDDALESRIETRSGGELWVNGNRLQ